jgi:methionyl-tRNA synthetase
LITSALPYANGPLHIGHVAGAYLNADIYVRHLRALGKDVVWVCGSDEHGAAITIRAQKEGTDPKSIVDRYHALIKDSFERFGISFDIYHRTSSELHKETAQAYFLELEKNGSFEVKTTEQYYDAKAGMFLADRYIQGTCPNCQNPSAYGDQCEKCGSSLSPTELIDPRSTLSGEKPELKETSHWFLPMERHEGWIKEWIEKGILDGKPHHDIDQWKKHVMGQCKAWLDSGLHSRAMTRDLDWGVPVPLEQGKNKVLYVWLDAPIGYISATKAYCEANGKDWKDYWQNDESQLIHFIGKDNIVFHCIIFPILLKEHGGYNLPVNVPANEFLNLEGDKISTSRNHAVWLHEYLDEMPGREEELRYVLTSIMPEVKDSEFTWDDYQARVNNELVAILGNFVNRCLVLTGKYFEGKVPEPSDSDTPEELKELFATNADEVSTAIQAYKFREAMQAAMMGARLGNKYLADTEPWKLIKTDEEGVKKILFESIRIIAHLIRVMGPLLPGTSEKLKTMLGEGLDAEGKVVKGGALGEVGLLFKKVEDEEMDFQKAKLIKEPVMETEEKMNVKPEIDFESFTKMDMRTGTILSAEPVDGADKLLQLVVKVGTETRQIVSGIAKHFRPEELPGKQVTVLLNLAPRKIRGVMSQGMILMAEDEAGKLVFISPEGGIADGSEVR